jgi:hypothetical protein
LSKRGLEHATGKFTRPGCPTLLDGRRAARPLLIRAPKEGARAARVLDALNVPPVHGPGRPGPHHRGYGVTTGRDTSRGGEERAMPSGEWTRRDVIRGLAIAALVAAAPLAAGGGPVTAAREDREARRRWALARMDEMARERLRCHDRFREPREVRSCQAEFERRHREYNELYIEAARD